MIPKGGGGGRKDMLQLAGHPSKAQRVWSLDKLITTRLFSVYICFLLPSLINVSLF